MTRWTRHERPTTRRSGAIGAASSEVVQRESRYSVAERRRFARTMATPPAARPAPTSVRPIASVPVNGSVPEPLPCEFDAGCPPPDVVAVVPGSPYVACAAALGTRTAPRIPADAARRSALFFILKFLPRGEIANLPRSVTGHVLMWQARRLGFFAYFVTIRASGGYKLTRRDLSSAHCTPSACHNHPGRPNNGCNTRALGMTTSE